MAETSIARSETGIARSETGIARSETGIARSETGIARSETGIARSETGIARSETGIARSETGIARSETGIARSETGIARSETGIVRSETGIISAVTDIDFIITGIYNFSDNLAALAGQIARQVGRGRPRPKTSASLIASTDVNLCSSGRESAHYSVWMSLSRLTPAATGLWTEATCRRFESADMSAHSKMQTTPIGWERVNPASGRM